MTSLVSMYAGLIIFLAGGLEHISLNSDKTQDVYTSGVIVAKWVDRRTVSKPRNGTTSTRRTRTEINYKIGVIYSLDPNQSIENKVFEKVKKRHRQAIRRVKLKSESGKTDINMKNI